MTGPETIDRALIGCNVRQNPRASTVEFTRTPNNPQRRPDDEKKDSVIFRIHPERESSRLIFQLGTASPKLAVEAAHIVAPYVAGIDVNSGCPKPFSTSGGMGAALLSTPDLLCSILTALVQEVGEKYEIGISVKIRLLKTEEQTRALVEQLCATGITGLTIHCRTREMRKTERAIREQLKMVGDVCREAGVACLMNGDVDDRAHAEKLAADYGVDGGMIATSAEKNPSIFRSVAEGGTAGWKEVVREYMEAAIAVENRWGNTKFLLAQMMPGKEQSSRGLAQAKNYEHICRILDLEDLVGKAREVDALIGTTERLTKAEQKARTKAELAANPRARESSQKAQLAGKGKRKGEGREQGADAEASVIKRQKQEEEQKADYLTDLHQDIVAPAVTV